MTTIHVDISVLPDVTADDLTWATLRMFPYRPYHVEDGGEDYIRSMNPYLVPLVAGVAEFDAPPTPSGEAMVFAEDGFHGARPRYVTIPDVADVDYTDLVEVDPTAI